MMVLRRPATVSALFAADDVDRLRYPSLDDYDERFVLKKR